MEPEVHQGEEFLIIPLINTKHVLECSLGPGATDKGKTTVGLYNYGDNQKWIFENKTNGNMYEIKCKGTDKNLKTFMSTPKSQCQVEKKSKDESEKWICEYKGKDDFADIYAIKNLATGLHLTSDKGGHAVINKYQDNQSCKWYFLNLKNKMKEQKKMLKSHPDHHCFFTIHPEIEEGPDHTIIPIGNQNHVLECCLGPGMMEKNKAIVGEYSYGDNQKWAFSQKQNGNTYHITCKSNDMNLQTWMSSPGSQCCIEKKSKENTQKWICEYKGSDDFGDIYALKNLETGLYLSHDKKNHACIKKFNEEQKWYIVDINKKAKQEKKQQKKAAKQHKKEAKKQEHYHTFNQAQTINQVQISENKTKVTNKSPQKALALLEQGRGEKSQTLRFKFLLPANQSWLGVGICVKNLIDPNKIFTHEQNNRIDHGLYLISSDKTTYVSHIGLQRKGWFQYPIFQNNCIMDLVLDPEHLSFGISHEGQMLAQVRLPVQIDEKDWNSVSICAVVQSGASIEII